MEIYHVVTRCTKEEPHGATTCHAASATWPKELVINKVLPKSCKPDIDIRCIYTIVVYLHQIKM